MYRTVAVSILAFAMCACQTSASRNVELAQICADPANRAAGTFYYQECQSLYPLTEKQRRSQEALARGVGDE